MKPLNSKLLKHAREDRISFHMPGHSGYACLDSKMDITEIEGFDNLLSSSSVILKSEKNAAKLYGKDYAIYSTQGSTLLMHVALNVVKNEGYSVISLGEMHLSFYNALSLFDIPYKEAKSIEDLINKCAVTKSKVAIFTTSPDYFGNNKDLKKLREIANLFKALLVVDSAHGAHFALSPLLPNVASDYADIAFYSLHKTMAVLTGGSVMVLNNEELYDLAKFYRAKLHSTSPSYLILNSLDIAVGEAYKDVDIYERIKEEIDSFDGQIAGFKIVKNDDFTRLVLKREGVNCHRLLKDLSRVGIDCEMAYKDMLVLIITPFNYFKLYELENALKKLPLYPYQEKSINTNIVRLDTSLKAVEFLKIEDAEGRLSANEIGIYPPGTPIVGEKDLIDKSIIKLILANKANLFGLVNGKIAVLK